jgi:mercuric ion transport protein
MMLGMGIRHSGGVQKASLAATLASAVAASICCIGPLAAAFLGLTGLGALVKFERYRPYSAALTLALLAGAFFLTYRRKSAAACAPGSLCAEAGPDRIQSLNRTVLWLVTVIVLLVLTFPTWSSWLWG